MPSVVAVLIRKSACPSRNRLVPKKKEGDRGNVGENGQEGDHYPRKREQSIHSSRKDHLNGVHRIKGGKVLLSEKNQGGLQEVRGERIVAKLRVTLAFSTERKSLAHWGSVCTAPGHCRTRGGPSRKTRKSAKITDTGAKKVADRTSALYRRTALKGEVPWGNITPKRERSTTKGKKRKKEKNLWSQGKESRAPISACPASCRRNGTRCSSEENWSAR